MRYAARVDENQPEIVTALRACGATVWIIGQPVDLLVGYRGFNYLLEIKDGKKTASRRKHTPAQVEFFKTWKGQKATVKTQDEALRAIGAIKNGTTTTRN